MRILASNPDTIGDMVLRQPLYGALAAAGHELMLVVRPAVAPLVPYAAPGAGVLELPAEVYRDDLDRHWPLFDDLFRRARDWRPDLLLVAPYQWTRFEERLADELRDVPGLRRAGLDGRLYAGDPHAGRGPESRLTFDVLATVREEVPEAEKNAALAAAVLGTTVQEVGPVDPRIEPSPAAVEDARNILRDRGLEAGGYWVACVTGTVHVPIKAWPAEHWGHVLGEWSRRYGRRFLLVGLPEERPVAEEVCRLMGNAADRAAVWMEPAGTIAQLIALTSLSAGYVGHDTGPMHLAAATGKPVLAVFGGGHWPRFAPRATPSVSLTVGVDCAGCGWACSFETSHCVKAVPPDAVLHAAEELEAGEVAGRVVRALEPSPALLNRMVGEAARFAQRQLRDAADATRILRQVDPERVARAERDRDQKAQEAAALAGEVAVQRAAAAAVAVELDRVSREAAGLVAQLHDRESAVVGLRQERDDARQAADRDAKELASVRAEAAEADALRAKVAQLEQRIAAGGWRRWRPRRHWREVLVDVVCGTREYVPKRTPTPMPRITFVVPADGASAEAVAASVESVLAQRYPHLDLVVTRACAGGTPAVVDRHKDDVREVCHADGGFKAVAEAFGSSDADVVGWLDAGDELEPGALPRAGEYFRDHRSATSVYFEDTALVNGWRTPPARRPRLDVYDLLATDAPAARVTAFFRRREYRLIGGLKADKGAAAGWELLARWARRYGLRRGPGYGACRTDCSAGFPACTNEPEGSGVGPASADENRSTADTPLSTDAYPTEGTPQRADVKAARDTFLTTFGLPGRVRCTVLHWANRAAHALRPLLRRDRLHFAPPPQPAAPPTAAPAPTDPPASPLTARSPERLLFTARDRTSPDRSAHAVYYDPAGGVAFTHPPVDEARMAAHYADRAAAAAKGLAPPDDPAASPYAGYSGGRAWERLLVRLPSPYWKFRKPEAGDQRTERLLDLLAGLVRRGDDSVRLLNVGCYEGLLLDRLKAFTKWQTAGTDSNARAARVARSKGHPVWETSPQDAVTTIPVDHPPFDVIYLSGVLEHLADPIMVLRRLRQLLTPGGWLAFDAPNLDSRLLDLYGPAWAHWQLPYHRTVMGRRGVRRLAAAADFRVARVRTYTDPYPAAVSAALAEMGLAATVPDAAKLPDRFGSAGARAAGWARLLWDWRGRGDYLFAALKSA